MPDYVFSGSQPKSIILDRAYGASSAIICRALYSGGMTAGMDDAKYNVCAY